MEDLLNLWDANLWLFEVARNPSSTYNGENKYGMQQQVKVTKMWLKVSKYSQRTVT